MGKAKLETVFSFGSDEEHELQYDPASGMMYLNGEKLVTEKRWSTTERRLAALGLVIASVGVAATVVQAWAAVSNTPKTDLQFCMELAATADPAANEIANLALCNSMLE